MGWSDGTGRVGAGCQSLPNIGTQYCTYILLSTCLACLRPLTHQPRHTHTRSYIYTHQPRPVSKLASLIYVQFHSFPAPCFRHKHINAHASWQLFQCFASLASASPSPPPRAHLGTHARSLVRCFNCPIKLDKKSGTRSAERRRSAMRWYTTKLLTNSLTTSLIIRLELVVRTIGLVVRTIGLIVRTISSPWDPGGW